MKPGGTQLARSSRARFAHSSSTQTRTALAALHRHKAPRNLVLVTHQVNITALTGDFTAMGEILLTRSGTPTKSQLTVLARKTF